MHIKLIMGLYVAATAGALVAIKLGSSKGALAQIANGKLELNITAFSILGVILYGISFLLYVYLISKLSLGYVIPITTALVYILIFFASFILFKEQFTIIKIAGITLILIGVFMLNSEQTDSGKDAINNIESKSNERAVG